MQAFCSALTDSGELNSLRAQQARAWMWSETAELLISDLKQHSAIQSMVPELEQAVLSAELPATVAAQRLIEHYKAQD